MCFADRGGGERLMQWYRAHARASWVALLVVVLVAVASWLWRSSEPDGPSLGEYGSDKQNEWAARLVAGLNTHEPEQVPVHRVNGQLTSEQRSSIKEVMPARGCMYQLVSVEDRGEQRQLDAPGLSTPVSTYRFNAKVDELCEGQPPRVREFGVVAIADMGYWEPFVFAE
ncbi:MULTISPECIES: hypothetical protein [Mycobacteriaceae]|uniref:Uncharacterized protein n=1 Tax=Mycolicibacterium neoaurum VKM Ac-1815D TaxID=700508 RepID=V5XHI1_MYCNE|nr:MULTISPECIES: hypothetical protein [Mycobacteriaceae]AHC27900.1 hypothetical protein D174_09725 [Mycolicibacterium neoaurum VKM Ac-1815D]AMO05386.1 hypothetical protein MyAD_09530 [Mycolicibacterium neoaurum]AXK76299.1 hypothetical protein DXK33_15520 [Mycolicibacterium neoaurum]KJQ50768.1 hypothetical protein TS71_09235 [Mycolicibacterium neoaurum]KUM09961.1 hypothetical protein AVZ31_03760 [Mycolicibacterium neoaurum]